MSVTDQSQSHLGSHYQTRPNENWWIGPDSLKRTPRPCADVTQLPSYHYLSVGNIPIHNRKPDDFQPRAQLRKLFLEGNIKCGDNDKIEAHCQP